MSGARTSWRARPLALAMALALLCLGVGACGSPTRHGSRSDPNTSETRAIAAIVRRYYAAAAEGNGAKACALLYYILAESLPEEYARPPGPLYLSGAGSCQAVLSRVFAHFHTELAQAPTVTAVRVEGDRAHVLLAWSKLPAGSIELRREGAVWKVNMPLAVALGEH